TDASPDTVTFTVDSVLPSLTFSPLTIKFDKKGNASTKVLCVELHGPCTGKVTVTSRKKIGKKIVTFAAQNYSIAAGGKAKTVKLHLSAKNLKLLRSLRSVKVNVTITVRDAYGNTRTVKKLVTIKGG